MKVRDIAGLGMRKVVPGPIIGDRVCIPSFFLQEKNEGFHDYFQEEAFPLKVISLMIDKKEKESEN